MKHVPVISSTNLFSSCGSVVRAWCNSMCILASLLLITTEATAQETHSVKDPFVSHHSLAILLGHTQTSQGFEDGKQKWIAMPSWALEYNYHLNRRWNIGLHNDIVMETFKVEDHSTHQEVIERTRPISSLVVLSYKIKNMFSLELGAGAEFAKEDNFFVSRLGFEYAYQLPKEWEVKANLTYDMKWEAYNSFSLGVGVGKAFGFRKKRHPESE
jgi:hypothetical protein